MPRPRHESLHRRNQRIRDRRKRLKRIHDERKRFIPFSFKYHFLATRVGKYRRFDLKYFPEKGEYFLTINTRKYNEEVKKTTEESFWSEFWDMFLRNAFRPFKEDYERFVKMVEWFRLMYESIRGRAKVVFKVRYRFYNPETFRLEIQDSILRDLPPDQRDFIVNRLLLVAQNNPITREEVETNPILRYWLMRYIAYYHEYPCTHNVYALKLTPITVYIGKGYAMRYYVMRFGYARDIKADPYIGVSRPLDFHIFSLSYKYDWDFFNTMAYSGYGTADMNDVIATARNDMGTPLREHPLRRIIFQPHHIYTDTAKAIGRPEMRNSIEHSCVYAVIGRGSPIDKLYDLKQPSRMIMDGKRRRFREIVSTLGWKS